MWFAKFGHLEFRQMDSIEDAAELVVHLRDQGTSMSECDEYGSPDFLERVGHGIVEEFLDRCDSLEGQREREWQERLKERERERSQHPGPLYRIDLSPPADQSPHLSRWPGHQHLVGGLDDVAVIAERDRLEALFGRDRITVRQERQAEEQ